MNEELHNLWLHAINCREAQINNDRFPSPKAFVAMTMAEEKLDELLVTLRPKETDRVPVSGSQVGD